MQEAPAILVHLDNFRVLGDFILARVLDGTLTKPALLVLALRP